MQYKTITFDNSAEIVKEKEIQQLAERYQDVMNQMAKEGWKLLGIHTIPYCKPAGCADVIFKQKRYWHQNCDVLIFFRD